MAKTPLTLTQLAQEWIGKPPRPPGNNSVVGHLMYRRQMAAARLWIIRVSTRGLNRKTRKVIIDYQLSARGPAVMKPTLANLYRASISYLQYSRSAWSNPHDTEYYSA